MFKALKNFDLFIKLKIVKIKNYYLPCNVDYVLSNQINKLNSIY